MDEDDELLPHQLLVVIEEVQKLLMIYPDSRKKTKAQKMIADAVTILVELGTQLYRKRTKKLSPLDILIARETKRAVRNGDFSDFMKERKPPKDF